MGEIRNDQNRKRDHYGGWAYGKGADEQIKLEALKTRGASGAGAPRPGSAQCLCCFSDFPSDFLVGGVCKACEEHLRCMFCGLKLSRSRDGGGNLCPECHAKEQAFWSSVSGTDPNRMALAHVDFVNRNRKPEFSECPSRTRRRR